MADAPTIELRPATVDMRDDIIAACRDTCERHAAKFPHMFQNFDETHGALIKAYFDPKVDPKHLPLCGIQAAFVNGGFAGYVILAADPKVTPVHAEIFDIHVFPEFRRRGVGMALLGWCKALVDAETFYEVNARVWQLGDDREEMFQAARFDSLCRHWRFGPNVPPDRMLTVHQSGSFLRENAERIVYLIAIAALLYIMVNK